MTALTDTLHILEAAIQKAHVVRARAVASVERLEAIRWEALKELAQPQPGDKELGLLDGIDLSSMAWAETVERETKARKEAKRSARR